MPHVTLTIELPDLAIATLRTRLNQADAGPSLRQMAALLNGVTGAVDQHRSYVRTIIASACASATVTCTQASAVDNTDTCTIGGTVLSVKAEPSGTAEFAKGSTNAEFAENLMDCINGNATLAKLVRATRASNVVTITALVPGPVGNLITLAEAGNGMVISGATLASGASDAPTGYERGYTPST